MSTGCVFARRPTIPKLLHLQLSHFQGGLQLLGTGASVLVELLKRLGQWVSWFRHVAPPSLSCGEVGATADRRNHTYSLRLAHGLRPFARWGVPRAAQKPARAREAVGHSREAVALAG